MLTRSMKSDRGGGGGGSEGEKFEDTSANKCFCRIERESTRLHEIGSSDCSGGGI